VAILLYYDGRRDLLHGLSSLFHVANGRTWIVDQDVDSQAAPLAGRVRDDLVKDGLIGKLIGVFIRFNMLE
jgi:hypothetical protein